MGTTHNNNTNNWLYKRQLIYLTLIFIAHGALFTNFIIRIPTIKEDLGISEGVIGWIIFCGGLGVLTSFTISGNLVNRIGSQRLMVISTFLVCIWLPVLGMLDQVVQYFIGFYILGLVNTIMDVAMNEYAVEFEKHYQKKIMSRMHGFFSLGTVITGVSTILFLNLEASLLTQFNIAALFWLLVSAVGTLYLYQKRFFPATVSVNTDTHFAFGGRNDATEHGPVFSLPPKSLVGLGIIAICGAIIEGGMMDWSTLFIHQNHEVNPSLAPLGLSFFALAMMIGRFCGDWLNHHIHTMKLIRILALTAMFGLILALNSPVYWIALIGFAMAGLGSALVYPIVFREAGRRPDIKKGHAVAGVASMGYCGFIFGPVVIGHLAEFTGLKIALTVTILAAIIIVLRSKEFAHH